MTDIDKKIDEISSFEDIKRVCDEILELEEKNSTKEAIESLPEKFNFLVNDFTDLDKVERLLEQIKKAKTDWKSYIKSIL
jgi:hypothetical protein